MAFGKGLEGPTDDRATAPGEKGTTSWRGPVLHVGRNEAIAALGLAVLLAVAILRVAVPDRSRLRPLSIQGFDIPAETIRQGQEITREVAWTAPDNVYVLGWSYHIGAPGAGSELMLLAPGETRMFAAHPGSIASNPAFYSSGAAYKVGRGRAITLRYRVLNTGAEGSTNGASALVYFVAAEGN